jgi:hypothetical protein
LVCGRVRCFGVYVNAPGVPCPVEHGRQIGKILRNRHSAGSFGLSLVDVITQGECQPAGLGPLQPVMKAPQTSLAGAPAFRGRLLVHLDQVPDGESLGHDVVAGGDLLCLRLDLRGPVLRLSFLVEGRRLVDVAAPYLRAPAARG